MKTLKNLALIGLALLLPAAAIATRAQEPALDCPEVVRQALLLTSERCTDMGRNQACYGNVRIALEAREGIDLASLSFDEPGDVVGLEAVTSLRLGSLDLEDNEWGVAYLRIRANLPDVAAGQFVTMLMFGDTEVRDASVELSERTGETLTPMQAFYFRTGIGGGGGGGAGAACREFPESGVLLQTPRGAGAVQMVVNEVRLTFGSTVLLQAPGEPETLGNLKTPVGFEPERFQRPDMIITTFEGEAIVEALGVTQIAAPGQQVSVPLDQDSRPAGPPNPPQYNDIDQQLALVNLALNAGTEELIELRTVLATATLGPTSSPMPTATRTLPPPPPLPTLTPLPTATEVPTIPPPPPPTPQPARVIILAGDGQSVPVGASFPTALRVQVQDANGNPVHGVSVRFTAPAEGAGGIFTGTGTNTETIITGLDGVAIASILTANEIAGAFTVTAMETYIGSQATFNLTNLPGPPALMFTYGGTGQSTAVGTPFASPLQAMVMDAFENPVSGIVVTFTAPAGGPSGTFAGSGTNAISALTNAQGVATATTFTANTSVGSYAVIATSGSLAPVAFNLTNLPGAPASLTIIVGNGQTAVVASPFGQQLGVAVQDAFGNPVPGATVTFTAPGAGASATFAGSGSNAITVSADGGGAALSTAVTANTVAGAYTITATSGTAPPATFNLTNTPGAAAAILLVAGSGQSTAIDTAFGAELQAAVRDAFNNPVPGVPVTFAAPSAGASCTFTGSGTNIITVIADASGVAASGPLTANAVQGSYSVSATSGTATPAAFGLTNAPPAPVVTNLNDSGPGSLRYVVANVPSGSTITFSVTGTITLTSGEIVIDKTLTINGPGAGSIAISGNSSSRVFNITAGTANISGVTIANGNAFVGGGVLVNAGTTLNLTNAVVSNNTAAGGGGLYSNFGTMNISRSTFVANLANSDAGGGIQNNGPTTIINSTFVNNSASGGGGGISSRTDTATIINSTFHTNTSLFAGGAIEAQNGQGGFVTLINSIVSTSPGGNCNGFINDGGGNLQFGDSSCGAFLEADPNFGGLTGFPAYLPINAPSPAENLGAANCPAIDQRGVPRGTPCDAGAFEIP